MNGATRQQHQPETQQDLPSARNKLNDAISNLIDPRPEHINNRTIWLNPRYHDLREALTSQRPGGKHQPRSQPPAWIDAIDTLTQIDNHIHQLEPDTPIADCDDHPTVQRLRAHAARKWRPQDVPDIIKTSNDLQAYAISIDKLFAQPPKYLPDKCPRCNQRKAARTLDGETVRVPALQITEAGCTCNNCHNHWPPIQLAWLGSLLGYRIQGVAEPQPRLG
ncbi:MAG: hypothetical protein K2Q25_02350 [Mycobacteriaceae bacterium]|nr:hypothetical protein [Mycobacteriaceae bacterium]